MTRDRRPHLIKKKKDTLFQLLKRDNSISKSVIVDKALNVYLYLEAISSRHVIQHCTQHVIVELLSLSPKVG